MGVTPKYLSGDIPVHVRRVVWLVALHVFLLDRILLSERGAAQDHRENHRHENEDYRISVHELSPFHFVSLFIK